MKKKKKNIIKTINKIDNWFFSILEFIAGIGIIIATMYHLRGLNPTELGIKEYIFQIGIIYLVLIEVGLKWVTQAIKRMPIKQKKVKKSETKTTRNNKSNKNSK